MHSNAILFPCFGMMLLTLIVWLALYRQRIGYLMQNRINPQKGATAKRMQELLPERVNLPAENLQNLFELPVLFYVICFYLYFSQQSDTVSLGLAYMFLVFRIAHSTIHCTYNKVMHRFAVYMISSLVLWAMLLRTIYQLSI